MTHEGRRPGDRRVRVERHRPELVTVKAPKRLRRPPPPALVLVAGFGAMIAAGSVLLMLPLATQSGNVTSLIDALFTATSAVCVTGLVVVDTGTYWSPFGQAVILVLIQAGGFGFMTSSTMLLLFLVRRRTTLRDRVLVQESLGGLQLGAVGTIIRRVAIFTLIAEAVGAVILTAAFASTAEVEGPSSAWWGLFHAVSAFNNAGFDVIGGFRSLTPFAEHWAIVGVIGVLIILGGLGYAIVGDVWVRRSWIRLALETKLVLATSLVLLVVGAAFVGFSEWENPATLGRLDGPERVLNAAFQSVTARTAGFNTVDTAALFEPTLFVVMALMFIGGASGSTAGGIKVNTFSVLLIAITSTVRGEPSAAVFGRRIQHAVVYRALSVALLSIGVVFVLALLLSLLVDALFIEVVFESVSAFGTVGLSTGITPDLTDAGRMVVTLGMFAGRLGPLTLVLALAARAHPVAYRPAVESVRIG
jgi:trk system potassium uptake protein TrkH